jgi:hypothetical protein
MKKILEIMIYIHLIKQKKIWNLFVDVNYSNSNFIKKKIKYIQKKNFLKVKLLLQNQIKYSKMEIQKVKSLKI